jgi:hypothetical protein
MGIAFKTEWRLAIYWAETRKVELHQRVKQMLFFYLKMKMNFILTIFIQKEPMITACIPALAEKVIRIVLENKVYDLNLAVLSHAKQKRPLLLFEKQQQQYCFIGRYKLTETHQNVQPDDNNQLCRVFVFHLSKISDSVSLELNV